MMFRELRESIQSEEDAAAVIRISRAREFKVKGLTTGALRSQGNATETSRLLTGDPC